jgi:hypothetical protein
MVQGCQKEQKRNVHKIEFEVEVALKGGGRRTCDICNESRIRRCSDTAKRIGQYTTATEIAESRSLSPRGRVE